MKPAKPRVSQVSKPKLRKPVKVASKGSNTRASENVSVAEAVAEAKRGNLDVVETLREHFTVEEVAV